MRALPLNPNQPDSTPPLDCTWRNFTLPPMSESKCRLTTHTRSSILFFFSPHFIHYCHYSYLSYSATIICGYLILLINKLLSVVNTMTSLLYAQQSIQSRVRAVIRFITATFWLSCPSSIGEIACPH